MPNPSDNYAYKNATGWGDLNFFEGRTSGFGEVTVITMTNMQCQRQSRVYSITQNMICAVASINNFCRVLVGGPLAFKGEDGKYTQIGIGTGRGCSQPGDPGFFTRVNALLNWVKQGIYHI